MMSCGMYDAAGQWAIDPAAGRLYYRAGDGENLVHIVTGITALTAGLLSVAQSESAAKRRGLAA